MSAKIISVRSVVGILALVLVVAGCTPAGPRAALKGKKYLDAGNYPAAVAQFKTAAELLATNATVWNYYGVALQRAGQPDDAVNAYRRALELDRDLLEARLNLGTLFLEMNKPDEARTEFTACTLRRPNDAVAWLKLGSAQLKLGEIVPAERSFSAVLTLKSFEAEAYNGLGLARIQRNRPREAAQFFAAAMQARPDYAAAILNLAAVNQQYLRDNKAALDNYRAYLSLTPRPANWDEVKAIASALEQKPVPPPAPVTAPAPVAIAPTPAPAPLAKSNPPVVARLAEPKPQAKATVVSAPRPALSPKAQSAARPMTTVLASQPITSVTHQVVQVEPAPKIVSTPAAASEPSQEVPMPAPPEKPSLWGKLFGAPSPQNGGPPPEVSHVTPLDTTKPATPAVIVPPAPVNFPRYAYLSPQRPAAGDRRAANGAFTQARLAEQNQNWPSALKAYREATALDPAWFEAQYNAGVMAHRLHNYEAALASYETALALQPDSADARYNFALALKTTGYAPDAAEELKKTLAANPGEARAHLALANLCAQSLHDPAQARQHYRKVLELDPKNPQASDIRFWLAANPG
jgi:tetratricopeptide (TPR) repeat protein